MYLIDIDGINLIKRFYWTVELIEIKAGTANNYLSSNLLNYVAKITA